jgi:hypothetical protein
LSWRYHQVVDGLIEHQKLAVAVVHLASGGILGNETQSVVVGQLLVVFVEHLERKQSDKIDHTYGDEDTHHQQLPVCQIVIARSHDVFCKLQK